MFVRIDALPGSIAAYIGQKTDILIISQGGGWQVKSQGKIPDGICIHEKNSLKYS